MFNCISLVNKKQPWKYFLIKAAIVIFIIVAAGSSFISRYRIGIDPQVIKCIPGVSVYLVDLKDLELQKNKTFVFKASGVQPFFEDGTKMVKFLRAQPGDKVQITKDQSILINNKEYGWGLWLAKKLNSKPIDFVGHKVLGQNEYWFMGLSDLSFDSRYWGTVKQEQVLGRAYPLF